jgi:Flp pilus assembly protein TadD
MPLSGQIPLKSQKASHAAQRIALAAGVALFALASAGCSTRLGQFTGSLRDVGSGQRVTGDSGQAQMQELARRYDARPGEKAASLAYGQSLRASGQHAQAVAVLERASIANVGDREVAAAYGRALGDVGRFDEAIRVLGQAHSADRPDWRVLSSLGVVHDQMGKHSQARDHYEQALKIRPDEPTLLSNLGLSYLLSRDLAKAEDALQRAAARPDADPRVAANLALVRDLRARTQASANRNSPSTNPAPKATRPTASAPTRG